MAAKFPGGAQACVNGHVALKPELDKQNVVVLGLDGTQAGRLMVVTSSGCLDSVPPESLELVSIEPGSRVTVVDAYHEHDPKLALKVGTAKSLENGLWEVDLDDPLDDQPLRISPRNLVLVSYASTGKVDLMLPSASDGKAAPVPPSLRKSFDRMQGLHDDVLSMQPANQTEDKENTIHSAVGLQPSQEAISANLEPTPDGRATVLHLTCSFRKGLMRDLTNRLSEIGIDVEQADISHPDGRAVANIRLVDEESGAAVPLLRFREVQDVACKAASGAAKDGSTSTLRGRRAVIRANSIEISDPPSSTPQSRQNERSQRRLLIIGPGFGLELNKEQINTVINAGFQVKCVFPPNPETPGFNMAYSLGEVLAAIAEFKPDLVAAASKGGLYLMTLWQMRQWTGPSLLINAHPSCHQLPPDVPVVVAHGSNDIVWPRSRADLERLAQSATPNMCFMYYTCNSGYVGSSGGYTRKGDEHNMLSLLAYDCLPRLIDAAISGQPEQHMYRSWLARLPPQRLSSEKWLGYSPEQLRQHWTSTSAPSQIAVEIPQTSEEFMHVATLFRSMPLEQAANCYPDATPWESTGLVRIERVQNDTQQEGSFVPYYEQIKAAIDSQGVAFEKGVHTRWAFHGTDAIDSIISNPISGFQPLASGTRGGSIWGPGTYFARDAKYVARAGFAHPGPDGLRRMLLCLLVTGMPCLADPENHGVLPVRCGNHRYHSTVDSMSNPEINIIQNPAAAYPAYIITFL